MLVKRLMARRVYIALEQRPRIAAGYDVARFAREIDPQLPVIYLSGHTSQASFEINGVKGSLFLPKPFRPNELISLVHRLVGETDV
jgi:DNA-binding response OmpR family regulator